MTRRDLKGVRIVTEGRVVTEAYFNGGGGPEVPHESVTSLLAGIAIDRKLIPDVQVPIARLLGSRAQTITLEQLLTMRSGLAADDDDPKSPGNEALMDEAASRW